MKKILFCLLMIFSSTMGFGQIKITGTVREEVDDGLKPLPGVTVTIQGIPRGSITDTDGTYTIEVSPNDKLMFSFIGMETQIVPINGNRVINVIMKEKQEELEDVTVVAFGKQKKESVIGSISTINTEDLKVPTHNLTTALAGRMAGVIAYQRSGEPGQDNAEFFIRGVTTFGYKKDPLILIDGIELTSTDLARLQPDDIASFSIMKDATATALYGARGANGVILVTSKEGREGKAKVSIRFENSISKPTRNVRLADPITYMRLANEAVLTRNPLGVAPYLQSKIDHTERGTNPYVYPATDWQKMLFRDQISNYGLNFNLSGGGKVARYYIAGTYNQDNGILRVDKQNNFNNNIDLKKYLLRSNININVTNTTEVITRLHGTFDDYTGPIDGGKAMYQKVMRSNPVLFPAYYPKDEEHQHVQHILFGNYDTGNYLNPYADMVKGYKDYTRSLMLAQVEIKQDLSFLTKGLSARVLGNTTRRSYYDVSRSYNPYYYQVGYYDNIKNTYTLTDINPDSGTEYLGYSEGDKEISSTVYVEAAVNYDQTFKKNAVSGLLVFTRQSNLEANAGSLQESLAHRNLGLSGRATYVYDNRYFTEFNFGYNGSERFAKKERFGFFPSAGIAWFASNEKFWDPWKSIVSKLKLRFTYGLVGNDAIGDDEDRFFYLSEVNMNNSSYSASFGKENGYSRNGISTSRYQNFDITWETAKKANLGVELGLFGKVEIQADFFKEKRTNILMDRASIPSTMGLQAGISANVGAAKSKGVDISVDYSEFFGKDYWITARGNFTYATSEFTKYEENVYENEWYLSHIGQSIQQQWGYIAERLFIDDADVQNSPKQNFGVYGAGDIKYRDVNGDDQITTLDRVPIGYPTTPEIVYGFGFSAGVKNFDFSAFFQGSARSAFWIDVSATSPFIDVDGSSSVRSNNQLLKAYADDHWSEDNRNIYALWPRLSDTYNENNGQRSTWFMRNGEFLRLKSVEVGYTLPKRLTQKMKMENLRIYFTGQNLLTFSKFKLWDIEMGGEGLGYPIQKVYNVGVHLSF